MSAQLNIFTNCHASAPDISLVKQTYDSFCETFGSIEAVVYMDTHPRIGFSDLYFQNLKNLFPNDNQVIITESLSDGYIKSIHNSRADFLFQLEGDWIFNTSLIKHSLEQITVLMHDLGIYHFRFNKRTNNSAGWESGIELKESCYMAIPYCSTDILSNNPHIIDHKKYIDGIINRIQRKPGSKGIEENLSNRGLHGVIYGGLNYPATVQHLDGRRSCI